MGDELPNLLFAHFSWMSFLVEINKPLNPFDVNLFSSLAQMFDSHSLMDFIQQF